MEYLIIGLLIWLGCGALAYAAWFAHYQRGWPGLAERDYSTDRLEGIVVGVFCGPVALLVLAVVTGLFKHGLKWR